jgi:hypothetical protein
MATLHPWETDAVRIHVDSLELVMSSAGKSAKDRRFEVFAAILSAFGYWILLEIPIWLVTSFVCIAVLPSERPDGSGIPPAVALWVGAASVLLYLALVAVLCPRTLNVTFVPGERPTHVHVNRWLRSTRVAIDAVTGITVVEYRERPYGQSAAGDAARDPDGCALLRRDIVLSQADGRHRTVRGGSGQNRAPRSELIYTHLAEVLASVGIVLDRKVCWRRYQPRSGGWISGGSAGANGLGGI